MNQRLSEIPEEHAMKEPITREYKIIQGALHNLFVEMQESSMSAANTPNENFLQYICNEIATQPDKGHQFEMEIRKQKLLAEGI
jgi:hypothetical protein